MGVIGSLQRSNWSQKLYHLLCAVPLCSFVSTLCSSSSFGILQQCKTHMERLVSYACIAVKSLFRNMALSQLKNCWGRKKIFFLVSRYYYCWFMYSSIPSATWSWWDIMFAFRCLFVSLRQLSIFSASVNQHRLTIPPCSILSARKMVFLKLICVHM